MAPEDTGEVAGVEQDGGAEAADLEDTGRLEPDPLEGRGEEARTCLAAGAPSGGEEQGAS